VIRARWWVLVCGLFPLALALAGDRVRPDPLPLRRVQIGPERVPAELERMQKGILVLLPRPEFEAKVQEAAVAVELADTPPRLIKTRYKAQLAEQALIGSAEWSVVHTAVGPGVLALPEFNLALSKRVKVDGGDGMLSELNSKTPALWIDKPGQPTIHFDWSRRGTPAGAGLSFDLQVPACANAQMELEVPVDYQLTVNKPGMLVDGPYAGAPHPLPLSPTGSGVGREGRRTWLLSFSGRSRVEFELRRLGTGTTLLLSLVQTRQELSPDRVLADYDFDIEALHGGVSQLVFDGDAPLQPYDVTLGGVEVKNWQWQPSTAILPSPPTPLPAGEKGKGPPTPLPAGEKGKGEEGAQNGGGHPSGGGVLVVPLREPLYGPLPPLRVRCLASVGLDKKDRVWVSPGMRLRGALARGERLRLAALPEVQLESWNPGQFRLTKTTGEPDGSQLLTLVHGGWQTTQPERPTAVLKSRTTEFLLEQQSWWQLDLNGSTLTSELVCKPHRGQLYHLPLKLPPDSQVDQLSVQPKELLRGWAAAGSRQMPMLLIDLAQPATPQTPVKIVLQLRLPPRSSPKIGPLTLELPDIEPQVPCLREGALAVSIHPGWRVQVAQSSWPATAAPVGASAGPWRQASPDYYFAFRGKPLSGQLRLLPRASQFQATCQSDALIGQSRGALVTRLTIEPTSGSLDHVDLVVSAALAEPWKVGTEPTGPRVASVQRLSGPDAASRLQALGARQALEALTVLATQAELEHWRLVFAEPVRGRVTLVLEAPFDPIVVSGDAKHHGERPWMVPVVTAVGAENFEGVLAVQLIGAEITGAEADQLQETPRPPAKAAMPRGVQQVWRVFRYDGSAAAGRPPSLRLKARAVAVELAAHETSDAAVLTTYVEPGGRLLQQLRFRLANWRKRDVPVLLPAGAHVLAARTEGRWLPSLPQQDRQDGLQVDLPASAASAVQHFDLYYALPGGVSAWAPWEMLAAPAPKLPVRPLDLRQSYVLPPGVVPLSGAWRRGYLAPGESPGANFRGSEDWEQIARNAWRAGQPLLASLLPELAAPAWAAAQKQQLAAAEGRLVRQFGPYSGWTLGPVVETMALAHLPADVPLVIDAAALAGAGISPETKFAGGLSSAIDDPWARLHLAMVPTPGGLLLTTQRQAQLWPVDFEAEPEAPLPPAPLADEERGWVGGVAQAAQRGHDNTGRFCSAAYWVRTRSRLGITVALDPAQIRGIMLPDSFGLDWTQWEPPAAVEPGTAIVLVRPVALHLVGVFLSGVPALAWVLAVWRTRSPRWQPWLARFLVGCAAVLALATLWLPVSIRAAALWPAGTAVVLGFAWYLASATRLWRDLESTSPQPAALVPHRVRSAVVGAAVTVALGLAAASLPPALSQGIDNGTVLVLPGPPDAPDRQDVLVTPELLKSLDSLIQRGPSGLRGAVVIAARYEGQVAGEVAQFKSDFQLHNFGKKSTLTIPLGGVELGEGALIDGVAVEPVASPSGYTVTVNDKGPHRLTLPFTVRVQSAPEHRDLHFTVPRLFQSQMLIQLPVAWPEPQVLTGLGKAQVTAVKVRQLAPGESPQLAPGESPQLAPGESAGANCLAVDLGRDSTVHLRWPGISPTPPVAKVSVREAYFWDLRSPGSTCTAVLSYTVKGGSVARFSLALPDTLEPRGVEVTGDGSDGEDASKPRLRDWHVAEDGSQRLLHVQLQGPAAGDVVVTLHFVPRRADASSLASPGTVRLPLPLPLGAQSAGGQLAYRAPGFETVDKAINMMTVQLPVEQFVQEWQESGQREEVAPTRAFGFRNPLTPTPLPDGERGGGDATPPRPDGERGWGEGRALVVSLTARRPAFEQDLLWTFHPGRADLQGTLTATGANAELLVVEWDVPPEVTVAEIVGDNIRSWTRVAGESRLQVWLKQPATSVSLNLRGWTLFDNLVGGPGLRWALPWLRCPNAASTRTVVRIAESDGVSARPDARRFVNLTALTPGLTSGARQASWVCQGPQDFYRAEFLLRSMQPPARVVAVTTVEAREGALHLAGQWLIHVPHAGLARFQVRVDNWQGPPLKLEGPGELLINAMAAAPGQQRWQITVPAGGPRHVQLKLAGARPCQAGTIVELPQFRFNGADLREHWLAARLPGLALRTAVGLADVKDATAEPGLPPATAERLAQQARVWKVAAADWKLALVAQAPAVTPGLLVLLGEREVALGEGCGWIHQARWWIQVKDTSELTIDMPAGALLLAASVNGEQVNTRFVAPDRLAVVLPPLTPTTLPVGERGRKEGVYRLLLRWVFGPQAEPLLQPHLTAPRVEGVPAPAINWTLTLPPGYRLAGSAAALDGAPALAMARHELARAEAQRAAIKAAGLDKLGVKAEKFGLGADKEIEGALLPSRGTVVRWQGAAQDQPPALVLVSTEVDAERRAWTATACVVLIVLAVLALSFLPRAVGWLQMFWPEQIALLAALGWAAWGFSLVAVALLAAAFAARLLLSRSLLQKWRAARQPRQASGAA